MSDKVVLDSEICHCSGREIAALQRESIISSGVKPDYSKPPFRPPWPKGMEDEDDYHLCGYCGKILNYSDRTLARCDICGGWFKGYKKYPKFEYTGPCCG